MDFRVSRRPLASAAFGRTQNFPRGVRSAGVVIVIVMYITIVIVVVIVVAKVVVPAPDGPRGACARALFGLPGRWVPGQLGFRRTLQ